MNGSSSETPERADPALVAAWLAARSIARGLPAPVEIPGGWMVETGGEIEQRRYVFAEPCPELVRLAQSIDRPGIYLKLCRNAAALRDILPPAWCVEPISWVMTGPDQAPPAVIPTGYVHDMRRDGRVRHVRILTQAGDLAASGYAAEAAGVFVYDRIVTRDDHRRLGLGTAVMALLGAERRTASRPVLVATTAGRGLYQRLGWSVHAPYASAVRRLP